MYVHFVFLVLGLLTIALTLASLRRDHIRPEFSVSWLVVGTIVTCVALFPGALNAVANRLGMDPGLGFALISGTLIGALVFETSHMVSRLRDENVILAQRLAILEFQTTRGKERNSAACE